jgi:outer membrane receptor protein involved in Fe transport
MNPKTSCVAVLLGSASFLAITLAQAGEAQPVVSEEIPETILVTGSLIRGTAAVGVPVTELRTLDFIQTGSLTTADLFRSFPAANVQPGPLSSSSGANIERAIKVNIRGLDTGSAARNLLMVDGMRVPAMSNGVCTLDPSIIPSLALERIDVLVDGASATYGSDAIGGVINVILKRNFDGAMTQLRYTRGAGGKNRYQAAALWGRTWDGGQVTLTYEWHDDSPIHGNFHSQLTVDFTPWGLDSRVPIGSSLPGTISIGAPAQPASLGLSTGTNATFGTGCTNCYAVPVGTGMNWDPGASGIGPTAPGSASTLNWANFATAANGGSNGTRNVFNPYTIAWYDVAEQSNRAVMTLDQRLTSNISFYGEGYYSNRRTQYYNPANQSPTLANIVTAQVPTYNPYYPTGGAPQNLRVSYNTSWEKPGYTSSYQVDHRYQFGLNIALPGNWAGKIYYAQTYTSSHNFTQGGVNKAGISAALGWTIPGTAAAGTTPAVATWAKPANIPYLNLFCDPFEFQCNDPATLEYATGVRIQDTKFKVNEKGAIFDGPLFDLPGGVAKAAIGATYTSFPFIQTVSDNTSAPNLILPYVADPRNRSVWATFGQLNVPVVGEDNALPGIARFEVETSVRHDQYSDFGGTTNWKASFNWLLSENIGFMIRGAWGQSFRAPSYADTSAISGYVVQGWAMPAVYPNSSTIRIECTNGVPVPGSAAEKLVNAGFACGSQPPGISFTGGAGAPIAAGWRDFVNQDQRVLGPENAVNWSLGFDYTPSGNFLTGLNLQATWYRIKISGVLGGFGISASQFNTAGLSFSTIVPSDVGCPLSADAAPTTCAPFQAMIAGMLSQPRSQVPIAAQTLVYWINDGGIMNKGWLKLDGIDWSASYDWEWGDIGAFNVGIIGTYYLHREQVAVPGAPGAAGEPQDAFHTTIGAVGGITQEGVPGMPRMRYRARLGWSNGPWSFTTFMDYRSHYFHSNAAPPNVNFQCVTAGGTVGGGTFPCLIDNYTNIVPSHYTFDISLGYNTMDLPANEYLRNIGVQLVVQNVMDKHPAFAFATGIRPGAWENLTSGAGRWVSLIVTKTW